MSVAIVIPTYNSAPWIEATVESALRQTTPAQEVIVIDDGSTDETAALLEKLGAAIRFIRQENAGVSAARNHGARLAAAEWLLFLDSDDRLLPHALEALLAEARQTDAGFAYGRVLMRMRPGEEPRLHGWPSAAGDPPAAARANYKRSIVSTPGAALVRRDLHERVGGFVPGLEPMEDRDFWIKCGLLARCAFCDTVVLDKTFREGSAGTQIARRIRSTVASRLALPTWAAAHKIDMACLDSAPRWVLDSALREALWHRRWELITPLRRQARELGLRTWWYHRAGWQLRLARLLGWSR